MLSAIGDTVHVLPVVNALKRSLPATRLTWVIQPLPHQLLRGHPAVDRFVIFHRRRGLSALRSYRELRRALGGERFDLLLDLQSGFKAGLVTAVARAHVKLGFDWRRSQDLNWLFTTYRIPTREPQHVAEQYLEFVEYLGINPEPLEWRLLITDDERARQRAFFDRLDRPACAVVLGSSLRHRNWPVERYVRLVDALESEFGFQPVLIGGPSAGERARADVVLARAASRPIDTLGDDLRRVLWLLDGSALVVSPDTGPLHIAHALGRPVVGLYGYTNPQRTGPHRRYRDLVVDGYSRSPDAPEAPRRAYRRGGMERVTVDAVLAKVQLARERYLQGARVREG